MSPPQWCSASRQSGCGASAWLARRGTVVRHVGLGEVTSDPRWPWAVRGAPEVVEPWMGPSKPIEVSVGVLYRDRVMTMPQRRRDVTSLVGGTWLSLAQALRPHLRSPRTLGQWGRRTFGGEAWRRMLRTLVSKRLGVSCDAEPAVFAGLLVVDPGAEWRTLQMTAEQASEAQTEAVLEAGGEVLDQVEVEALEVEDDRVTGVMTEFGREWVTGRLLSDLPPIELALRLTPGVLSPDDVAALRTLTLQERAVVRVSVQAKPPLPREIWVADARIPVVRMWWANRTLPREPSQLMVELETFPGTVRARAIARSAVERVVTVTGVHEVERIVVPVPTRDPEALRALARLRELGIEPVGSLATHLPLTVEQEARMAAGVASGPRGVGRAT